MGRFLQSLKRIRLWSQVLHLSVFFFYRTGEHSHHPYSSVLHAICGGFLHSQLHGSFRSPFSCDVDGIGWESSGCESSKQH